jgi:hypothetical protein
MPIVRSQLFLDRFHSLQQGDPELFEVVAADLRYLLDRRRGSQLPQVGRRLLVAQLEQLGYSAQLATAA